MIDQDHLQIILDATGADSVTGTQSIQLLWSGYGEIVRVRLKGGDADSVIAKWVHPPSAEGNDRSGHPRGWNTNQSHLRKLRSYEVETNWYRHYSQKLLHGESSNQGCRIAKCYRAIATDSQWLIVLEDLDDSGFDIRRQRLDQAGVHACLNWLANFHASFLAQEVAGLWPVGTYWHLDTRPDEWAAISDGHPLKSSAEALDQALTSCKYQTLVHGDAKVANFCFSRQQDHVAAVDFQYVGGGCGMKDVAYFLGSCLNEDECERDAGQYLDFYFGQLRHALEHRAENQASAAVTAADVEAEWRPMYPLAWADFHRFLLGWCPGHQKLHRYTQAMTDAAINMLA